MSEMLEGLLGHDNIFNHFTSLPDVAWRVLRDTGVSIPWDPRSNAQYALQGSVFAYQQGIDQGIRSGTGTAIETSYGREMFVDMRHD
jgi:5-methylthioadenosine/S-adenosylhomocysteine deaminase